MDGSTLLGTARGVPVARGGKLDLKEYAEVSRKTAIYPQREPIDALYYTALGLVGEAGEYANLVKKVLRDFNGVVSEETRQSLKLELGDIQWYWCRCLEHLGLTPEEVLQANLDKLQDRKSRRVLGGSGDNR